MLVIACNPGMCLSALPMIEGLRTQSFKIYKEVHLDVAKVELKQPIVAAIAEDIKDAQSVVIVDYRGLTVAQDTELRKQLREAGVIYKVYKNTMMNFAVEGTQFEGLKDYFEGPSAIAICYDDPTVAAGILSKYMKTAKTLEFKAGVIEGTCYDAKGMVAVADIPSREVLLSRLLGSFQGPMASFARVIKAIADKDETAEA